MILDTGDINEPDLIAIGSDSLLAEDCSVAGAFTVPAGFAGGEGKIFEIFAF